MSGLDFMKMGPCVCPTPQKRAWAMGGTASCLPFVTGEWIGFDRESSLRLFLFSLAELASASRVVSGIWPGHLCSYGGSPSGKRGA